MSFHFIYKECERSLCVTHMSDEVVGERKGTEIIHKIRIFSLVFAVVNSVSVKLFQLLALRQITWKNTFGKNWTIHTSC